MIYALNLDKETKRILSATYPQYAPTDAVTVETLPDGNIADYLYVDGEYVYDPLPEPEQPETPTEADYESRIAALEEELAATKILLGVE